MLNVIVNNFRFVIHMFESSIQNHITISFYYDKWCPEVNKQLEIK